MRTLGEIGDRWFTDKGTDHSYLPVYESLFEPMRNEPIHLLEIGAGGSTGMWLEYFPNGWIYAIDRKLPTGMKHERLWAFEMDQCDEPELNRFQGLRFDVIIDDGSHESWHQLLTCHALWRCLKPGGRYFIEDVPASDRIHYWAMMPGFEAYPFLKGGREDDILIMLRKSPTELHHERTAETTDHSQGHADAWVGVGAVGSGDGEHILADEQRQGAVQYDGHGRWPDSRDAEPDRVDGVGVRQRHLRDRAPVLGR